MVSVVASDEKIQALLVCRHHVCNDVRTVVFLPRDAAVNASDVRLFMPSPRSSSWPPDTRVGQVDRRDLQARALRSEAAGSGVSGSRASILQAQILYSGILEIGSRALIVSRLAAASAKCQLM